MSLEAAGNLVNAVYLSPPQGRGKESRARTHDGPDQAAVSTVDYEDGVAVGEEVSLLIAMRRRP